MCEYLISYDLRNMNNYSAVCGAIIGVDMNSSPCLYTSWVARSDLSAEQIASRIRPYLAKEDRLFVVKLADDWSGVGLTDLPCVWLHENIHA